MLIQTMDKGAKSENKYFSSPLKKKSKLNRVSSLFQLSEAPRNMDDFLFSMGMQSTGS